MPLVIDDHTLKQAGLTEQEARIEFACRLYDAGKLSKVAAARLCQLDRVAFESELQKRNIDIFRYTSDDLDRDVATLDRLLGKP